MIFKYKNGTDYFVDFERIMDKEIILLDNQKNYEEKRNDFVLA